ncbi:hypothetical protein BGZ83_003610, partial [Gryganskiella cystojenkinii]
AVMRETIESHRALQITDTDDEDDDADEELQQEADDSWMYEEPPPDFNCNIVVASSPIEPVGSPEASASE